MVKIARIVIKCNWRVKTKIIRNPTLIFKRKEQNCVLKKHRLLIKWSHTATAHYIYCWIARVVGIIIIFTLQTLCKALWTGRTLKGNKQRVSQSERERKPQENTQCSLYFLIRLKCKHTASSGKSHAREIKFAWENTYNCCFQ